MIAARHRRYRDRHSRRSYLETLMDQGLDTCLAKLDYRKRKLEQMKSAGMRPAMIRWQERMIDEVSRAVEELQKERR